MSAFDHYIKAHDFSDVRFERCLLGPKIECMRKPEFLVGYTYRKLQHYRNRTSQVLESTARIPACRQHAEGFAKKFKLELPEWEKPE